MSSSYYRSEENDYNDLEAPVWDDVEGSNKGDHPNRNPIDELSQTFANIDLLGTPEQSITNKEEEETDEEMEQPMNTEVGFTSSSIDYPSTAPQEDIEGNHADLMAKLAPEGDPGLTEFESNQNAICLPRGTDDPLFAGNQFASPLKVDIEDNNTFLGSEHKLDHSQLSKKSQLQQLFNGKRLRRRRVPVERLGEDPLGKAQKDDEFVEEDLNAEIGSDASTNGKSTNSDIIRQMESPLYQLSPRKDPILDSDNEMTKDTRSDESTQVIKDTDIEQVEDVQIHNEGTPFRIEVKDPIKIDELTSSHIEYMVNTISSSVPNGSSQLRRRYSDFRWLYRQLQNNHWGKIIPPPPEKQAVGRFKDDFVESRRLQMESMLNRIAKDPVLQKDDDFIFFLSSDSFTKDSKIREYSSGSAAYNDNNDLSEIHISEIQLLGPEDAAVVLKNGGLDAENNRGFMNLSFSSPPKYIEQDVFFLKEYDKLTLLELQLKQLYKSFDLIDTQRNELSSTIEEFSKLIRQLAKLEVTKQSTQLLTNFAEVQEKIKQILERNALQDVLTVAATIDEYIRSLSSVRATFKQRKKLGYYLGIVEADLNKKLVQFNKQTNNGQRKIEGNEKLTKLKDECDTLKSRYDRILKWFNQVAVTIKKELRSYNKEKIKEARNSIEISLEGAIESQKECIELWETFFQTNL